MFVPVVRRNVARAAAVKTQVRNAATLAELKARITSIGSIEKLTKAMKMVAVSKLRHAQDQLEVSRKFASGLDKVWDVPEKFDENPENLEGKLFIVFTSDSGLCGGVNTQIIRKVRPTLGAAMSSKGGASVMVVGDKGKSAMERQYAQVFTNTVGEVSKVKKITFKQVSKVAELVSELKFLQGGLYYNKFINSSSSEPTEVNFYPADILLANTEITSKYENEGDDEVYHNFWEFSNAVRMFHASAESYASETAARMAAMSSSSKNAAEILQALSLTYNRQRQAKITSELTEIISGAAAAEEM